MDTQTVTTLWVGGIIMTLGFFAFSIMAASARRESKLYYYSFIMITLIGALSYFAMASGLGSVRQGDHSVLFAHSIDWIVTTPLLLLNVALIALPRVPGRTQLIVILLGADVFMMITCSIGAFIRSDDRWGWFGTSTACLGIILYLIVQFMREARQRGPEVARLFCVLSKWVIVLWICYPIFWALGTEGLGIFRLFIETILFGVLDICAKIGIGFIPLRHPSVLEQTETAGPASSGP